MYSIILNLSDLSLWQQTIVISAAAEHNVTCGHMGESDNLTVSGPDDTTVRLACSAGLQRVGLTIEDVNSDHLF